MVHLFAYGTVVWLHVSICGTTVAHGSITRSGNRYNAYSWSVALSQAEFVVFVG